MIGYLIRRIAGMVLLLFLLTLAVFFLFNMIPGDPARLTCGKVCTPTLLAANRHKLELDIPPVEQYTRFLGGLVNGRGICQGIATPVVCDAPCLGYSFVRHQQVLSLIRKAIPVTFWLAIGGFIIWIVTGLTAGIYAALHGVSGRTGRSWVLPSSGTPYPRSSSALCSSSSSSSSGAYCRSRSGCRRRTGSRPVHPDDDPAVDSALRS